MKSNILLLIFLLIVFASNDGYSQSVYLYYPNISEGMGTAGHEDEIMLSAVTGGRATGSVGGGPYVEGYRITRGYDPSSTNFLKAFTDATATDGVEIRFYENNTIIPARTISLKGAIVSGYLHEGTGCGTCPVVSESIYLSYTKIRINTFMWDKLTNTPTF